MTIENRPNDKPKQSFDLFSDETETPIKNGLYWLMKYISPIFAHSICLYISSIGIKALSICALQQRGLMQEYFYILFFRTGSSGGF